MELTGIKKWTVTVILVTLVDLSAWCQQIMRLSVEEGLSQGFVRSIVQDESGFMWMGTVNGLNRYDGYDFKVYRREADQKYSLLSSTIGSLTMDEQKRLWIKQREGIQYYDERVDGFITPAVLNQAHYWREYPRSYIGHEQIILLARDTLWEFSYHTVGGAVEIKAVRTTAFPVESFGLPLYLQKESDLLYIGTTLGMCVWDGRAFRRAFPEVKSGVWGVWSDSRHHHICVQTATSIYFFKGAELLAQYELQGASYGIPVDGQDLSGNFLIVWGADLWEWDGTKLRKKNQEWQAEITAACVDRQKNIWLGLDIGGVICLQNRRKKIRKILNPGTPATKAPLIDPNGGVWLNLRDGNKTENMIYLGKYIWSPVRPDDVKPVVTEFKSYYADIDGRGRLWGVNASKKLTEFQSGRVYNNVGGINEFNIEYGVSTMQDGTLLLLSYSKRMVMFFNPDNGAILPPTAISTPASDSWWEISSLSKARSNSSWTWYTSPRRIIAIKPDWKAGKISVKEFDNRLLPKAMVGDLRFIFAREDAFDPDIIWIGTWDGLLRWRLSDSTVINESIKQGEPEPVFCMAQTEPGVLWLGAQQGLFRYNYQTGQSKIYTQADGLPALEFNRNTAAVLPDGMIVMGTTEGSICFYPEEMLVHEEPKYMAISRVQLGTKILPIVHRNPGYTIAALPYGSDNLTVYFSLLDFTNMRTAQYRFRLSSGNDKWVANGLQNSVSLAGLSPGKYALEVQGSLNGSEWSKSEWLYFEIENPWWKSGWAMIGLLLLLGVPTVLVIRNKRLLMREKYQNELLRMEVAYENALTKTKERILANVAHDLRTPLTLITGLAERIGGDSDEKITKAAETIKYQSQELLNMINQILDLGRIRELGGIPLSPALLELEQFLSTLLNSYAYQAQEKSIRLYKRLAPGIPVIYIDESGLRAILGNLLSNALKFTPQGGRILLEAFIEEQQLHILVQDSGPGIPPEKVKFLFQRYFQIDGEKYPGGVGIGLAYASEMAELMGGQLSWAPPALGTVIGAVFSVTFPLEKLKAPILSPTAADTRNEASITRGIRNGDQKPLVLVVEDQQAMADYIRSILEPDYEVVTALHGQAGLELTIELIPDLVISDVMMPQMSGLELCMAVKKDIRTSHIPIILLSAKSSNTAVRAGLASGASLYLSKPFDHEILKKYVANSLLMSAQTKRFFESSWSDTAEKTLETQLPDGISREKEDSFIREVEALIAANYVNENFTVENLAAELHISISQLRRKIAALGGESAGVLLRKYRLTKAKEMLREKPDASISEVAFACGFSDPNYFSTLFGKEFGMTPRQYRGASS